MPQTRSQIDNRVKKAAVQIFLELAIRLLIN